MNTFSKTLVLGTALITGMALAAPGFSDDGDGWRSGMCRGGHGMMGKGYGMHRGDGPPLERLAQKLNLTDEQVTQIQAIKDKNREQSSKLRDEMREHRNQMRELMDSESVKESDVRKLANKQGKTRTEMMVLRMKQHQEIRKVLTEEQREQLKDMRPRFQRRS